MSGIQHPAIKSFIGQKCDTERGIEYWSYVLRTGGSDNKKTANEVLPDLKKKLQVLDNLISLYGPNPHPQSEKHIVVDVYGDSHVSWDPVHRQLPSVYKTELYEYSYLGTQCYARMVNRKAYLYIPDGTGKYKFWRTT